MACEGAVNEAEDVDYEEDGEKEDEEFAVGVKGDGCDGGRWWCVGVGVHCGEDGGEWILVVN